MAEDGVVGEYAGSQAREVLITMEQWASRTGTAVPAPDPAPRRLKIQPHAAALELVEPIEAEIDEEEDDEEAADREDAFADEDGEDVDQDDDEEDADDEADDEEGEDADGDDDDADDAGDD
jgi:S-DNA-T family DNA segregation ATPase FtsK/SpoIIIE